MNWGFPVADPWTADQEAGHRRDMLEEARLEGFRDCEELVIAWLERTAAAHPARHYPALALALAVRMGEHKKEGGGVG